MFDNAIARLSAIEIIFILCLACSGVVFLQQRVAAQSDIDATHHRDGSHDRWDALNKKKKAVIIPELMQGTPHKAAAYQKTEIIVTLQEQGSSDNSKMQAPVTPTIMPASGHFEVFEAESNVKKRGLKLRATLSKDGKPVIKDLKWHVYDYRKDINGHRKHITNSIAGHPLFMLPKGRYYITVHHGDAQADMKIDVNTGEQKVATINLNAGYLKVRAVLMEGGKPVTQDLEWHIWTADQDLNGQRKSISYSSANTPLFKLNQGRYYVTADHGNAHAAMNVDVVAGESKTIVMNFKAGYLKWQAVLTKGDEPVTQDLQWHVYTTDKTPVGHGKTISYSSANTPLFILNQGRYYVTADHGNAHAAMNIDVGAGEHRTVAMNLKAGYLKWQAVLAEGDEPVTQDLQWHVYAVDKNSDSHGKTISYSSADTPLFILNQGRYYVTADHGDAHAAMDIDIAIGERKEVTMNLKAGYLKWQAVMAEGAKPVTQDLQWHVYAAGKYPRTHGKAISYSSADTPLFRLNQGRYYVTADYGDAHAAMNIDLAVGDKKEVTMNFAQTQH